MAEGVPMQVRLTGLPGTPLLRVDPVGRRATLAGRDCGVTGRAFDLLCALCATPGVPVKARALQAAVWEGRVVVSANLRVQVRVLRQALGAAAVESQGDLGYALRAVASPTNDAAMAGEAVPGAAAPPADGPLFGRDDDLRALQALLQHRRLVTLVGPLGVGKSRLARHALAALAAATDAPVTRADLSALPVPDADAGQPEAVLARGLLEACPPGPGWLLLDNAEHLANGPADAPGPLQALLPPLLAGAPALRCLVTSQQPLGLPDECLYRLAPLPLPDPGAPPAHIRASAAVRLLASRAAAADQRYALTDDQAPAAAAIVHRLDGLPLALALAGARLPLLGATALADQLRDPLRLLGKAAPGRPAALREAIGRSIALLPPTARRALVALAPLAPPFPPDQARARLQDQGLTADEARQALQALVDCLLLLEGAGGSAVDAAGLLAHAPPPPTPAGASLRLLATHRAWALQATDPV